LHGDSLLAQSTLLLDVKGGPKIDPVDSFPFTDAVIPPLTRTPKNPITNKEYLNQFSEGKLSACCLPAGLNLNAVDVLPFNRGPKHFSGVLDRSHSGHRDNRPPPRQDRAAF
jgi:hypothetical protein